MGTENRISKRDFLAEVSESAQVPQRVVTEVYDALVDRLIDNVQQGRYVTLTGFGKFYGQRHRGHTVQFAGDDDQPKKIDDYSVLKFSAANTTNKRLGELQATAEH